MKKFLLNVITYVLALCLLTVLINTIYIKLDKRDIDCTRKFKSIPNNIEICNVGSSHGLRDYNYDDLENEYTCFNFGLSGQYPSYDYRLLDYYQNKLAEGCIVFVNISYFTFIGIKEENDIGFASKNKRYYKILDAVHIKQFDSMTNFIVSMPSLDAGIDLVRAVFGRLKEDGHVYWTQTADEIDLKADVKAAYLRHIINNKIDENNNWIINQEEIDAVYSIIDLCHKKNWIPILVTTPFLKEYTDKVQENSPEYMDMFYNMIENITESTGTPYYDYSLDKRFLLNYDLFMNGDHLNQDGARKYTNILSDEVIKQNKNSRLQR